MANSLCRKDSDCGFRFSETGEEKNEFALIRKSHVRN